jgi:hypothetical protein
MLLQGKGHDLKIEKSLLECLRKLYETVKKNRRNELNKNIFFSVKLMKPATVLGLKLFHFCLSTPVCFFRVLHILSSPIFASALCTNH